jgi:pantoate--beta-alanine ligase
VLVAHTKQELAEQTAEWRRLGDHIALVPTMGNLHAGHLALVDLAREHAERVIVSIFVNPTQFGEGEDFEDYPRTLERDKRRLKKAAADMIFAPDVETSVSRTRRSCRYPVLRRIFAAQLAPAILMA